MKNSSELAKNKTVLFESAPEVETEINFILVTGYISFFIKIIWLLRLQLQSFNFGYYGSGYGFSSKKIPVTIIIN